jgi:hypothetical protein
MQIGTRMVYCPNRSYLRSATTCDDVSLASASLTNNYFVLEKAPKVPGQPELHGQFYIRAAVRAAADVQSIELACAVGQAALRSWRKGCFRTPPKLTRWRGWLFNLCCPHSLQNRAKCANGKVYLGALKPTGKAPNNCGPPGEPEAAWLAAMLECPVVVCLQDC